MRYLARRLLHAGLLLVAISFLTFVLAGLAPGDYFLEMRTDPRLSAAAVDAMRERAGLDRPLPVRYVSWAAGLLRGEFGWSLAYNGPVWPLLRERLGATLLLTGVSTLAAWLLAMPLGIWNAVRRGGWSDAVSRVSLSVLLALPELLLALVFLVIAARTGWFPAGGMASAGQSSMSAAEKLGDLARHLALPAAALALGLLPALARQVRASMIEALDSPFALSARSHGIGGARMLGRHLLPAAANPLIALAGLSLGTLLSGSLLVEVAMGWPGLGPLFLEAIMARDFGVVVGVVMLSAACLAAGNLLADLLLYRADPRIRGAG